MSAGDTIDLNRVGMSAISDRSGSERDPVMCDRNSLAGLSAIVSITAAVGLPVCGGDPGFDAPEINVPQGFMVELTAGPPLVEFPMMGCLDELGRLFVAESRGQNLDKAGLLDAKHRFIRMLEDTDGDGRFDRSTIFADELVMPEGAVWYRGSLYVLSSPYLWRFEDTNGDGVADVREKLVGEMEFNGKANQHGAYLGPCGRLYFSGGTFGYDLVGSDGNPAWPTGKATAAGVFSCRLDGSRVEIFATGGINPVEVAFSSEGELFTTCPIIDNTNGRRDALIHWIRGATVGPKDFRPPPLPQTGYRLPALVRWGQVAPSGLMIYRGESFGPEYRGRLFATHFNTGTIVTTRLERNGSTFRSFDEDFLTSPNPEFHPTDIMEDADGSLLLIDTGGWFRISCPFSKTARPEIPGAIYRVRRTAAGSRDDPRGLALNWKNPPLDELFERLGDARHVVRDRAIIAWHVLGDEAVDDVPAKSLKAMFNADRSSRFASTQVRRNAVWAASRIESSQARLLVLAGLEDPESTVRQAAVRSAGILRETRALQALRRILLDRNSSWPLRRAAATSLGQIGDSGAVQSLLTASAEGGDDFFNHAVIYALIEIGDFGETVKGLRASSPQARHASLVALSQIDAEQLTRSHVSPLLETDDPRLQQAVLDLISQREGWSDEIIAFLDTFIAQSQVDPGHGAVVRGAIVSYVDDSTVQQTVARALNSDHTAPEVRSILLEGIARLPNYPDCWLSPLSELLAEETHPDLIEETVAVLSASGTRQLDEPLRAVATTDRHSDDLRAAAWRCLCGSGAVIPDSALMLLVLRATNHEIGPLERLESARAVAAVTLTSQQLEAIANQLDQAGPMELSPLLGAFEKQPAKGLSAVISSTLLESLSRSSGLSSLSRRQLDALQHRVPDSLRPEFAALTEQLEAGHHNRAGQLDEIAAQLVDGSVERGRQIFFSNQTACSACHRVEGTGGTIGPDLTWIGEIRQRRDLLEAIVFPDATIVNNYETWTALMTTGRTHTGVIQRATARTVILRNHQRIEFVLNRQDIDQLIRQPTSMMPQGLERTLTPAELSDLLAFLQSLRNPVESLPETANQ